MTPDFTKLPYGFDEFPRPTPEQIAAAAAGVQPWIAPEGFAQQVLHTSADAAVPHQGFTAGTPPFLGGPYATMYAQRAWTIRTHYVSSATTKVCAQSQ